MSEPQSSQSPVDESDSSLDTLELRVLIDFVSRLGMAMSAAGQSVSSIQGSLAKIAHAYGMDAQIAVLPDIILVKLGERELSRVGLASHVVKPLRLDQTAAVFALAHLAERAEISPADGLRRLDEIERGASRFGAAARILGYALIAVGIGLILEGSFSQLVTCILLGVLIGELKELSGGNRTAAGAHTCSGRAHCRDDCVLHRQGRSGIWALDAADPARGHVPSRRDTHDGHVGTRKWRCHFRILPTGGRRRPAPAPHVWLYRRRPDCRPPDCRSLCPGAETPLRVVGGLDRRAHLRSRQLRAP